MKRGLWLAVAVLLASCTQSDQERAKQKAREAGRELKHDADKASQEIKRESEEVKREAGPKIDKATRELKEESHRVSEKLKNGTGSSPRKKRTDEPPPAQRH